jgi:hypothetical protein
MFSFCKHHVAYIGLERWILSSDCSEGCFFVVILSMLATETIDISQSSNGSIHNNNVHKTVYNIFFILFFEFRITYRGIYYLQGEQRLMMM